MKRRQGFTLVEVLVTIFLLAMVLGCVSLLLDRSFRVLRHMEEKGRAQQAARMGLDRMTSEVREATRLLSVGGDQLRFEKVDPTATINEPPLPPEDPPDDWVPPAWTPQDAYGDSQRLVVEYSTSGDRLLRRVRQKSSGAWTEQVAVTGVNTFSCQQNSDNPGEVEVTVSVWENQQVRTLSSRVLCPCVKEPWQ